MNFEVYEVDVDALFTPNEQPAAIISREPKISKIRPSRQFTAPTPSGTDWVLLNGALGNDALLFSPVKTGNEMRVPLMRYETKVFTYSYLVGLCIQIGMDVVYGFRRTVSADPILVRLVMSKRCIDDSHSKFQFFVGFSVYTN